MTVNKRCRVCDELLTDENWRPSSRNRGNYICKKCQSEQARLWKKENPDKVKANNTRANRKRGMLPMSENKDCAPYLGVYVTERYKISSCCNEMKSNSKAK